MEKGDFEYASYALNNKMQAKFHSSEALPELLEQMQSSHHDLVKFKVGSSIYWHEIWWQTALNFNQENKGYIYDLNGDAYNEEINIAKHLKVNDASTLFLLYTAKLILSIFFKEKEKALLFAQEARKYLKGGAGMYAFILFHFYESLALLQNITGISFFNKKKQLFRVNSNLKILEKWSTFSPDNHLHRLYLLRAEYSYVIKQKYDTASYFYEMAIEKAHENNFKHEEALCYEFAATYYQYRHQTRFFHLLLKNALNCYQQWGAKIKVKQLLNQNFFLRKYTDQYNQKMIVMPEYEITRSSTTRSSELDLQTIFKSSQAISGIVVLDEMIKILLTSVMENAGAQKGFLILNRNEKLYVEAQGDTSNDKQNAITALQSLPINEAKHLLSVSLVNYVKNSEEFLVLDNATKSNDFSYDPYIINNSPISVLCVPILNQGVLSGIVYLENNLTAASDRAMYQTKLSGKNNYHFAD